MSSPPVQFRIADVDAFLEVSEPLRGLWQVSLSGCIPFENDRNRLLRLDELLTRGRAKRGGHDIKGCELLSVQQVKGERLACGRNQLHNDRDSTIRAGCQRICYAVDSAADEQKRHRSGYGTRALACAVNKQRYIRQGE
jgi:hypothetical protein